MDHHFNTPAHSHQSHTTVAPGVCSRCHLPGHQAIYCTFALNGQVNGYSGQVNGISGHANGHYGLSNGHSERASLALQLNAIHSTSGILAVEAINTTSTSNQSFPLPTQNYQDRSPHPDSMTSHQISTSSDGSESESPQRSRPTNRTVDRARLDNRTEVMRQRDSNAGFRLHLSAIEDTLEQHSNEMDRISNSVASLDQHSDQMNHVLGVVASFERLPSQMERILNVVTSIQQLCGQMDRMTNDVALLQQQMTDAQHELTLNGQQLRSMDERVELQTQQASVLEVQVLSLQQQLASQTQRVASEGQHLATQNQQIAPQQQIILQRQRITSEEQEAQYLARQQQGLASVERRLTMLEVANSRRNIASGQHSQLADRSSDSPSTRNSQLRDFAFGAKMPKKGSAEWTNYCRARGACFDCGQLTHTSSQCPNVSKGSSRPTNPASRIVSGSNANGDLIAPQASSSVPNSTSPAGPASQANGIRRTSARPRGTYSAVAQRGMSRVNYGHGNGNAKARANGRADGSVDGHVNGPTNGHANGHVNSHVADEETLW